MLLTGILTFTMKHGTINTYAQEENSKIELDYVGDYNSEESAAERKRLLELAKKLKSGTGKQRYSTIYVLSNFPNLKQGDPAWRDCIMQSLGLTIWDSGCCLTSFTMVQQYYGGTDTPDEVNECLGDAACPFYWEVAKRKYNYEMTKLAETVSYEDTLNYVMAAVSEQHPVIIGMDHSSKGQHFVVAYGYAYDNIIIMDPAESRNYLYLGDYMNEGYYINRVVIYTK